MPSASATDNKTTLAYQPPAPGPPMYAAAPPGPGTPQGMPAGPPQGGYAPQGQPPYPNQQNAAQIGEEYRAQLYARCAQGIHEPTTKYGICGIITAVVCFPIGLICLFTDTEQRCDRCGIKLS
ncbi:hypothetical protein C8J57DRAFT_1285688 [Mycena rebaudengoi]|nr:hypothetical protein C8J57DRAFT_1285688 [Mycena rebaudengoi]